MAQLTSLTGNQYPSLSSPGYLVAVVVAVLVLAILSYNMCALSCQIPAEAVFVFLLQGVQELTNSYVDQQQETEGRGDEVGAR